MKCIPKCFNSTCFVKPDALVLPKLIKVLSYDVLEYFDGSPVVTRTQVELCDNIKLIER